jgi:eukaryotic-like serine/threonine-protein kinase
MPDNRFVVFSSLADGATGGLMKQAADGSGRAEPLIRTQNISRPSAVLPDGRILVTELRSGTSGDIMVLSNSDRTLAPLIETAATDRNAEVSPNGRWIAYESNDTKQFQVYLSPFPEVNKGRFQVSTRGGTQPAWSRSGEELFYLAEDGALMKVDVGGGDTRPAGTPIKVFDSKYYRGTATAARTYDVSPDGKRFLMIKNADDPAQSALPITIVVVRNWSEELKRLVPRPR